MLELLQKKEYDRISVQEIIERADVGRSTFYAHYRCKEDLLLSGFDGWLHALAAGPGHPSREVEGDVRFRFSLPLLRHIREQRRLFRSLIARGSSSRLRRRVTSMIAEATLRELTRRDPQGSTPPDRRSIGEAQAVAGALVGVVSWWIEAAEDLSAEIVDEIFQRATGRLGAYGGVVVSLGLESGRVRIVPWRPEWAKQFEDEADEILRACGERMLRVEHIGSTAVPGLPAKPVLDLMGVVSSLEAAGALVPALTGLGYEPRPDPDVPDRLFLRKRGPQGVRTHHLSLVTPSSRFYRLHLAFRDHLRSNSREVAAYAALKSALAKAHPNDREAYTKGKTDFVRAALARAGCEPLDG